MNKETNKFATREVFNFHINDEDGLLFTVSTAKSNSFIYDDTKGYNVLEIEDALFDMKLFTDVFNGKYHNKHIRITGRSVVRNLEQRDCDVALLINVGTILSYDFRCNSGDIAVPVLRITFPSKDGNGFGNMNIHVMER